MLPANALTSSQSVQPFASASEERRVLNRNGAIQLVAAEVRLADNESGSVTVHVHSGKGSNSVTMHVQSDDARRPDVVRVGGGFAHLPDRQPVSLTSSDKAGIVAGVTAFMGGVAGGAMMALGKLDNDDALFEAGAWLLGSSVGVPTLSYLGYKCYRG